MLGGKVASLGGRNQRSLGDAQEGVLRLEVVGFGEVAFVGGDERLRTAISEVDQPRLDRALAVEAMALQLDIQPIAKFRSSLASRVSAISFMLEESARSSGPAGPPVNAMRPSQSPSASMRRWGSSPSVGSSQTLEARRIRLR